MSILKILSAVGLLLLMGCASSEPQVQKDPVNVNEIRANASQAYTELNAEEVKH